MTRTAQLLQLKRLADLILDSQLAQVRTAAAAKQASEDRLAALASPMSPPEGIADVPAGLAALNYQRWADARRFALNAELARQTAAWLEACDDARLSFGRTQALQGVVEKLSAERKDKRLRG